VLTREAGVLKPLTPELLKEERMKTAKFWVGLAGGIVTSLLTVYGPDTRTGQVLTVISALVTALGVYLVPNAPKGDDEATAAARKAWQRP
jgi:hypothetical protein